MSHVNKLIDSDPHFVIDINTRNIKNMSATKTSLVQFDHNSERFSFTLPRFIEGHDMLECNSVQVHYLSSANPNTIGLYSIDDLAVCEDDSDHVCCTWLISQNVTQNAGVIQFLLRFACVAEDGTIEYAWHTNTFTGISVSAGMNNGEVIEKQYADILEQFKAQLNGIIEDVNNLKLNGGGGGYVDLSNYYNRQEIDKLQYYGTTDIEITDPLLFEFDETTGSILEYIGEETSVVIPYKINGVGVTRIGDYAFRDCKSLTSITIPDGVTSIGGGAFYYCHSLSSITIPDGVTSIGDEAFSFCYSLTSITIPSSVTSIGEWAFSFCYSLSSITIPDGVTSIGDYAFEYCTSLTSITIPNSVTNISSNAFDGISSDATFYVCQNSYAEEYVKNNNKSYMYDTIAPIEPQNIDLSNYYTKKEIDTKFDDVAPFIINVTIDENKNVTSETTFKDIKTAYDEGKQIICKLYDELTGTSFEGACYSIDDNDIAFRMTIRNYICTIHCNRLDEHSWSYHETITATEEYVDNLVGDIETALDNIIQIQNELMGVSGE